MNKCKYCADDKDHIISSDYTNEIHINNEHIRTCCGWCGCMTTVKINYCPMCGKKLAKIIKSGSKNVQNFVKMAHKM